jgi:hypothetical protein
MSDVTKRIVKIFAQAQALQQNGRLKSTIYCLKKAVFIMNQDHTILIRFPLRSGETPFKKPVSFNANDYDSSQFVEKDGNVVFTTSVGEYVREKSCRSPQFRPKYVKKLFGKLESDESLKSAENNISLGSGLLKCLNDNLSHIEFRGKDGELKIVQRDIYAGSVIRVTARTEDGLHKKRKIQDFKAIGIRTNDFVSLFLFAETLRFTFASDKMIWVVSKDPKMPFTAFVGGCVYDEMGMDKL